MFEDVLGYPNVEKLRHGVVEYVPSPVTIWDKELLCSSTKGALGGAGAVG